MVIYFKPLHFLVGIFNKFNLKERKTKRQTDRQTERQKTERKTDRKTEIKKNLLFVPGLL